MPWFFGWLFMTVMAGVLTSPRRHVHAWTFHGGGPPAQLRRHLWMIYSPPVPQREAEARSVTSPRGSRKGPQRQAAEHPAPGIAERLKRNEVNIAQGHADVRDTR
jgi:hypothetical protein